MHADDVSHRLIAVAVPAGSCMATLVEPGPSTPRTGCGVVVIPALGIEHAGADRLVRLFADHAARLGHVVLIVEPVGTGDSTDLPDDVDLVSSFHQAISAGVRTVASHARHVVVMGTRFGALATVTSFAHDPRLCELVDGVVLIEPIVKGRNYRRELLMLGASTSGGVAPGASAPAGFLLRPCDLTALHELTLDEIGPPARQVLVVHAGAHPLPASVVACWAEEATIESVQVPFEQVVIEDPERGRPVTELITSVTEWMACIADRKPVAAPTSPSTLAPFRATGHAWQEDGVALTMADGEVLHGVRTLPMSTTRAGLVLLSTGTNPRFGPARLHTALARRLAEAGVATLRIERRGAGVDGRTVDAYNPVHIADALAIDQAAPDVLHTSNITLAGMCSGAWAAWHATLAGVRARNVVLMNQIIFGEDSWDLAEDSPAMAVKTRQSLGDPERWRAILRGEIRMMRSARNLARYAALTTRNRFGVLGGLHGDLATIVGLETSVHFVFDDAESGLVYLKMHGGVRLTELVSAGTITIDVVHQAGHVFASPSSVSWLSNTLAQRLGVAPIPAVRQG